MNHASFVFYFSLTSRPQNEQLIAICCSLLSNWLLAIRCCVHFCIHHLPCAWNDRCCRCIYNQFDSGVVFFFLFNFGWQIVVLYTQDTHAHIPESQRNCACVCVKMKKMWSAFVSHVYKVLYLYYIYLYTYHIYFIGTKRNQENK